MRQGTEAIEAESAACSEAFKLLDGLKELTDLLLKAALLSEGYHQHHRGEWRRRRATGSEGICVFYPGDS
jgi:hypothetical protein